jgi:hypothetical protein
MKRISILIILSFFLAQLQAQTQDSSLWAKDKNELVIASSIYLGPLLGFQSGSIFQPVLLYKRKIMPNKILRVGILGRNDIRISEEPTQISIKDTILQTFGTQKNYSRFQFHLGIEKQRFFRRNNRFRASYGCDMVFSFNNDKEQLNGKRYIKTNDVYVLSNKFVAEDFKLLSDQTSFGLGLSPLFGVDYRIFDRIYLGGVINMVVGYNFTKKKIDTNTFYTPTLSFRF